MNNHKSTSRLWSPSFSLLQLNTHHRSTNTSRRTEIRPRCTKSAAQGTQHENKQPHQHRIIPNTVSIIYDHQQRYPQQHESNSSCGKPDNKSGSGEFNQQTGSTFLTKTNSFTKIEPINTAPENLSCNQRPQTHRISGYNIQPAPWFPSRLYNHNFFHVVMVPGRTGTKGNPLRHPDQSPKPKAQLLSTREQW